MNTKSCDHNVLSLSVSQEDSVTTERKILMAAEREFFEKGFAGARTTSIAESAGVTHAMLHYYFRTKSKLFERIISDKMSLLGELSINSPSNDILSLMILSKSFDFVRK